MNHLVPTFQTQGNRPMNVYEWHNRHVIDWLKEHDLQDYQSIFEMQKVNGEQLLLTTEEKAIHEFKIEDDEDRKIFMQELDLLKEYHDSRRKANMIEEAEKLQKEASEYLETISMMPIHNGMNGGAICDGEMDLLPTDSSIQQFEDNDSATNRFLLEQEIKMIVGLLQRAGSDRIDNSANNFNDTSQRYGMTLSKPYILSSNNLVVSTTSIQQPQATSTDYQSQWYNESIQISKMKIPHFFEHPVFSKDHQVEQSERISEAQSYQENFSTLPITNEEKLQSIVNQSLIIKDCLDLDNPQQFQLYELLSSEIQVANEGIISQSQSNPHSKRKLGLFKFMPAQKSSKQELSFANQQTINIIPSNLKCNWSFRSLNSSQIIALQVMKRAIVIDDTYIMGNHIINIMSVEIQSQQQCKVALKISRINNQIAFQKQNVFVNTEGITFGKNKKTCTIYLENDKEVSSNHCRMVFDPQLKSTFIIDNSSTNGTWIQIKAGKNECLGQKMHIQIDLKRDIMIYDCIDNYNLDDVRKELQNNCISCFKNNKNTRNLNTQKIEYCLACAQILLQKDSWAQILY
ncbi:FHA domain protein (macronuclear) [Tetrahymena thermophila SB210]|uniref:FHA domain protein n=2 Tax=Tetrahymena thermophila (strain SB210) TaxID=312017 RepID=Q239M7_TETTS|nr:FHA domain protein [Tetrahymena thermophila SB210]EAR93243.2 FHA domain protein [Tetrahymena thermophila SB210]|eukprot:XP_001013488.2 FHA domain protein [Tetrahymena thermophila SB210]